MAVSLSPVFFFFFFFKFCGVSVDSFSVVMAEGEDKKVPGDVAQENATVSAQVVNEREDRGNPDSIAIYLHSSNLLISQNIFRYNAGSSRNGEEDVPHQCMGR